MTRHRILVITGGILLLSGCTALREPVPIEALPTIAEPRAQYQVWSHGSPQVLIALRTTADSLSGVPYWKPPTCDSCRVANPPCGRKTNCAFFGCRFDEIASC